MYLSWHWRLLFSPLLAWGCLFLNFFLLVTLKYKYFQKRSAADAGNALQLLESSQTNLQSISNTIPDIVFRLDKNSNIIFISSAVTKYESPQTPLLGKSIFDLVIPEDLEKARFKLNERRTGVRATQDFEVKLRFSISSPSQANEVRYFNVSAAGFYEDEQTDPNTFIGTQGIVKDITKRKQIENQLLQAKKMEAMGNLAAGIAHDLNNILSGIVSYPDMILADLSESDPMYKKISLIKKPGTKAAIIVQDLLTLARRSIHPQDNGMGITPSDIPHIFDTVLYKKAHTQQRHRPWGDYYLGNHQGSQRIY
ncbi:MAG: PAS domain S-box-containing protein [Desulforhopalus sp.]